MAAVVVSVGFGMLFGLALAAPPGPMNAIIAEESVLRGWFAGFKAGFGALTADFCFFLLALIGAVTIIDAIPRLRAAMVGIGGLLMLYFAYDAVRETAFVTQETVGTGKGFWKALVLALTNPYQIVFWLTVGIGLLRPGTVDVFAHVPVVNDTLTGLLVITTGSPAILIGLFLGILCWIVLFPASLVFAGQRIDRFAPTVAYLSAVVLVAFGAWFLTDAATTLL